MVAALAISWHCALSVSDPGGCPPSASVAVVSGRQREAYHLLPWRGSDFCSCRH